MVQAILEGRKTQTRRAIKPQPIHDISQYHLNNAGNLWVSRSAKNADGGYYLWSAKCPYGQVGDVLWVRETWQLFTPYGPEDYYFGYKASPGEIGNEASSKYDYASPDVWKPSIHMPYEAARIFLRITDIRVERLQDISEDDAIAEGVERVADYGTTGYKLYTEPDAAYSDIDAKWSFESLWQSINGADSWDANPWVWVVTFERIPKP